MKHLYLMRHGETLFNVQKRTQGWCDSPLTEKGIADAKSAHEFMKHFSVKFDAFYSSTSERASDTLEIIFPNVNYKRLKGLKEMNFGAFEGQPTYLEVWDKSTFYAQFNGETREALTNRMLKTLTEMLSNPIHNNIFAVSHGAACWFFLEDKAVCEQATAEGFHNLDLMHFAFDGEHFIFKEIIKTV